MTTLLLKPLGQQVNRIFFAQCVSAFFLSAFFCIINDQYAGLAALLGCLVYILPGYLYAKRLFLNVSPRSVVRIMCVFYIGEVLKLVVSIVLFIALLKLFTFPLLPYFVGYLVAALTFCVASIALMSKTMVKSV